MASNGRGLVCWFGMRFLSWYAVCLYDLQMQNSNCTLVFIDLIVHFFARGFAFLCMTTVVFWRCNLNLCLFFCVCCVRSIGLVFGLFTFAFFYKGLSLNSLLLCLFYFLRAAWLSIIFMFDLTVVCRRRECRCNLNLCFVTCVCRVQAQQTRMVHKVPLCFMLDCICLFLFLFSCFLLFVWFTLLVAVVYYWLFCWYYLYCALVFVFVFCFTFSSCFFLLLLFFLFVCWIFLTLVPWPQPSIPTPISTSIHVQRPGPRSWFSGDVRALHACLSLSASPFSLALTLSICLHPCHSCFTIALSRVLTLALTLGVILVLTLAYTCPQPYHFPSPLSLSLPLAFIIALNRAPCSLPFPSLLSSLYRASPRPRRCPTYITPSPSCTRPQSLTPSPPSRHHPCP